MADAAATALANFRFGATYWSTCEPPAARRLRLAGGRVGAVAAAATANAARCRAGHGRAAHGRRQCRRAERRRLWRARGSTASLAATAAAPTVVIAPGETAP